MRGNRRCGSCNWFEDRTEEAKRAYASWQGLCHWRMPATVAKDLQGWGDWHQKGTATVKKQDWCSCWTPVNEHFITNGQPTIESAQTIAITDGSHSQSATRKTFDLPRDSSEIKEALKRSRELWDAMDEEEQEAEMREQRKSWSRQDQD